MKAPGGHVDHQYKRYSFGIMADSDGRGMVCLEHTWRTAVGSADRAESRLG